MIPRNTSVIVARVPLPSGVAAPRRNEQQYGSSFFFPPSLAAFFTYFIGILPLELHPQCCRLLLLSLDPFFLLSQAAITGESEEDRLASALSGAKAQWGPSSFVPGKSTRRYVSCLLRRAHGFYFPYYFQAYLLQTRRCGLLQMSGSEP